MLPKSIPGDVFEVLADEMTHVMIMGNVLAYYALFPCRPACGLPSDHQDNQQKPARRLIFMTWLFPALKKSYSQFLLTDLIPIRNSRMP